MIRALLSSGVALSLALGSAPIQCASRHPPELAHEDSPPESLWNLSERFAAQHNPAAQRATLEYLVERYPSSRFAERARTALQTP